MTLVTLTDLPFELLTDIIVLSHCPSLFVVNRRMHAVMRGASNNVRAQYLIAAWESYCRLGIPPMESSCRSRMSLFERCEVLDFCLRFPICNDVVLKLLNTWLMDKDIYDGRTCMGLVFPGAPNRQEFAPGSVLLAVTELPERLFRSTNGRASSTTYPHGQDPDEAWMHPSAADEAGFPSVDSTWWPLRCSLTYIAGVDWTSILPLPDLLLLLTVLTLHAGTNATLFWTPWERYTQRDIDYCGASALQAAVRQKNFGLCSLLLALGVPVHDCGNLSLNLACRSNWLEGTQLLLQKNVEEEIRWGRARWIIFWWALGRYECHLSAHPPRLRQGISSQVIEYQTDLIKCRRLNETVVDEAYKPLTAAHFAHLREHRPTRRTSHPVDPRHLRVRLWIPSALALEACRYDAEDVARYIISRPDFFTNDTVSRMIMNHLDRWDKRRAGQHVERGP